MQILLRVVDGAEGHEKFDPISVQNDNEAWGRQESLDVWVSEGNTPESWPKRGVFVIVSVPGVDKAPYKYLEDAEQYLIERDKPISKRVQQRIDLRARKYKLDIIPFLDASGLDKLANGGTIVLSQFSIDSVVALKQQNVPFRNTIIGRLQARDPSVVAVGPV